MVCATWATSSGEMLPAFTDGGALGLAEIGGGAGGGGAIGSPRTTWPALCITVSYSAIAVAAGSVGGAGVSGCPSIVGASIPGPAGCAPRVNVLLPENGPTFPATVIFSGVTCTPAPARPPATVAPTRVPSGADSTATRGSMTERATPGAQNARLPARSCCSLVAPNFFAPYSTPLLAAVPSANPRAIERGFSSAAGPISGVKASVPVAATRKAPVPRFPGVSSSRTPCAIGSPSGGALSFDGIPPPVTISVNPPTIARCQS